MYMYMYICAAQIDAALTKLWPLFPDCLPTWETSVHLVSLARLSPKKEESLETLATTRVLWQPEGVSPKSEREPEGVFPKREENLETVARGFCDSLMESSQQD